MKKLAIALMLLVLSACAVWDNSGYKYIIYAGGSGDYYYCKTIDVEKRIGYDCADDNNRGLKEFHMSITDSWALR